MRGIIHKIASSCFQAGVVTKTVDTMAPADTSTRGQSKDGLGIAALGQFLMLPGQVVSVLVLVLPLLVALYMSFTNWSPTFF